MFKVYLGSRYTIMLNECIMYVFDIEPGNECTWNCSSKTQIWNHESISFKYFIKVVISIFHKISTLVNIIYKCVKKKFFVFKWIKWIHFHGIKDMLTSIYNRFLREQNSNFYTINPGFVNFAKKLTKLT